VKPALPCTVGNRAERVIRYWACGLLHVQHRGAQIPVVGQRQIDQTVEPLVAEQLMGGNVGGRHRGRRAAATCVRPLARIHLRHRQRRALVLRNQRAAGKERRPAPPRSARRPLLCEA
jgi:hypothetical protein